jgi:hypothetical protein
VVVAEDLPETLLLLLLLLLLPLLELSVLVFSGSSGSPLLTFLMKLRIASK